VDSIASGRPWVAARHPPRGHLAALALLVLGIHAMVVTTRGQAIGHGTRPVDRMAVQVRMVAPASMLEAQPVVTSAAVPVWGSNTRPVGAVDPLDRTPAATTNSAGMGATTKIQSANANDPFADFLPRAALTSGPRPNQPVLIDFPDFVGAASRYSARFEILVDDAGGVVQVVGVDPELPQILLQAVREAFTPVRFTPGELDGWPVRSRFRIEVTFDSRAQPG
jgi:hypothetical protein